MQLTFLEAAERLTKTYEKKTDGSYVGGMYPGARNFTSHVEDVDSIQEFTEALRKHAADGHCLLTNGLVRPIHNESRAKLSDTDEARNWIVLDLDGLDYDSADAFINDVLPSPFHNVSYVIQHSPSSGIKPGLRMHLFFLLDNEVDPKIISNWLKYMNLATKSLSNQITLSKSAMALSLKLDIVANNNGRIIYITPPECVNFEDPIEQRIELVEKDHEQLSFNFASISHAKLQQDYREKVDELRESAGFPKKRAQNYYEYSADGGERLRKDLTQPARITAYEADNEYFMRCNLDGGDSWAYYYHRKSGLWLHNFKGEPSLHIPTLDPEFYDKVARPDAEKLQEKERRPFVFRDSVTDKYYVGMRQGEEILVQPHIVGSEKKIEDYFVTRANTSPPANIDTWERMFDPTVETQWIPDERRFNFWRPTDYMKNALVRSRPPETIDYVLRHVTGNDEESYERLVNWIAYIYQTRRKTGTAWVLHGCPGTGKGLLTSYILRPIIGSDYCHTTQMRDLKSGFNGWMEHAIIVNVDETNSEDAGHEEQAVIEAIKHWVTEPIVGITAKHQNARNVANFTNFIFTTNEFGVLPIQEGDRRFNVSARQEKPITIGEAELEAITSELAHFAGYLKGYKVDELMATRPLENEAKRELQQAARNSIEEFAYCMAHGDLEYFIQGTHEETKEFQAKDTFKKAVDQWIDDAKHERASFITKEQLRAAYVVMCANKAVPTNRFLKIMAKKGHPPKRLRSEDGERLRGWRVEWNLDEETKATLKLHLKAVKTTQDIEKEIQDEVRGS